MNAIRLTTAVLLAGLVLTPAAYAADAADDAAARRPAVHRPSIERMAIGNALTAELATQTGRPATEIQALLQEQGPRAAAETLGLERDAMREALRRAREQVIAKALQAQMISAEQAATLRQMPDTPRRRDRAPRDE